MVLDKPKTKTLLLEDVKLVFRNFAGREKEYNSEGDRNFSVLLEPELAKQMIADGWRVKQLKPRQEEDEGDYHLKVTANYKKGRPPRCVMISSKGRTDLGMEEIDVFDIVDIMKADVLINGWYSDMAGGGYGGFLKSLFITINEDELEKKYEDIQNASSDLVGAAAGASEWGADHGDD